MNRKRTILIFTLPLLIVALIGGSTWLSMIQANAQDTSMKREIQPIVIISDTKSLVATDSQDRDNNKMPALNPNSFFDVQH